MGFLEQHARTRSSIAQEFVRGLWSAGFVLRSATKSSDCAHMRQAVGVCLCAYWLSASLHRGMHHGLLHVAVRWSGDLLRCVADTSHYPRQRPLAYRYVEVRGAPSKLDFLVITFPVNSESAAFDRWLHSPSQRNANEVRGRRRACHRSLRQQNGSMIARTPRGDFPVSHP